MTAKSAHPTANPVLILALSIKTKSCVFRWWNYKYSWTIRGHPGNRQRGSMRVVGRLLLPRSSIGTHFFGSFDQAGIELDKSGVGGGVLVVAGDAPRRYRAGPPALRIFGNHVERPAAAGGIVDMRFTSRQFSLKLAVFVRRMTAGSAVFDEQHGLVRPCSRLQEALVCRRVHEHIAERGMGVWIVRVRHPDPGREEHPVAVVLRQHQFATFRVLLSGRGGGAEKRQHSHFLHASRGGCRHIHSVSFFNLDAFRKGGKSP